METGALVFGVPWVFADERDGKWVMECPNCATVVIVGVVNRSLDDSRFWQGHWFPTHGENLAPGY